MFPYGIKPVQKFSIEQLKESNYIYISSVCMKTKCLQIGSFNDKLDSIEDWDYWLRIAQKGFKIGFNPKDCITYICKKNGMASKNQKKQYDIIKESTIKKEVKLNLGCGNETLKEYINCDLYNNNADMIFDAKRCPFDDQSVDEIRAYHLIEHFDFKEGFEVLKEWNRILKPNGRLVLETPDLLNTCKVFVDSNEDYRIKLYGHFFAWPWIDGQQHKFLYTENQIYYTLKQCGFNNIKRLPPDSIYVQNNPKELYLKIEAYKNV